jgi:hypothetical protein
MPTHSTHTNALHTSRAVAVQPVALGLLRQVQRVSHRLKVLGLRRKHPSTRRTTTAGSVRVDVSSAAVVVVGQDAARCDSAVVAQQLLVVVEQLVVELLLLLLLPLLLQTPRIALVLRGMVRVLLRDAEQRRRDGQVGVVLVVRLQHEAGRAAVGVVLLLLLLLE